MAVPTDTHTLAKLAREVAMEQKSLKTICEVFDITEKEYLALEKENKWYRDVLQRYVEDWESALNSAQRIKIGALACIEDTIPIIWGRMKSGKEALTAVVDGGKHMAKLAGLDQPQAALDGPGAGRFLIQINMGGGAVEQYGNAGTQAVAISVDAEHKPALQAIKEPPKDYQPKKRPRGRTAKGTFTRLNAEHEAALEAINKKTVD